MILHVIQAEYLGGFKLRLVFNDGHEKTVDLKEYISLKKHPFFKPLKEVNNFKNFKVENTIFWDTGADIAPEYLYNI